jgi:hypothetical protein
MSKEEEEGCPHQINLTVEEEDAINWLQHHLEESAGECGPTSRMAHIAHVAVGKMFSKLEEMHRLAHVSEVTLLAAEMVMSKMAGVPSIGEEIDKKKENLN